MNGAQRFRLSAILMTGPPANRVAKGTITTMSCDPATSGFQMTESYVLGPSGEELTQFSLAAGVATWQRTNVYAAGGLLATYDVTGLHFHIADPVGTRRMQVGGNLGGGPYVVSLGQPETVFQSLPYGDQLAPVTDQEAPASADDSTPLHFTGKERDSETQNDYFGARYYASTMARFLSPDWNATAEPVPYATMGNPQSLNLFAYVGNNPLVRADADGHDAEPWSHVFNDVGCNDGDFDDCSSSAAQPGIEKIDWQNYDAFGSGAPVLIPGKDRGKYTPSPCDGPCKPPSCTSDDMWCSLYWHFPPRRIPAPNNGTPQQPSSPKPPGFSKETCFYLDWGMGYLSGLAIFTAIQPEAVVVSAPLGVVAFVGWGIGKVGGC